MIERIKSLLNLKPLQIEGGYFIETYRSEENLEKKNLPKRYSGDRSFSTAIYYMLTPDVFSSIHKVKSDEIFHFYLGDPVEMIQLFPDGSGKIILIGNDILNGLYPQVIAPRGIWQGARLKAQGEFALMGTTVAPGFEYSDYEAGKKEILMNAYPDFASIIELLC